MLLRLGIDISVSRWRTFLIEGESQVVRFVVFKKFRILNGPFYGSLHVHRGAALLA